LNDRAVIEHAARAQVLFRVGIAVLQLNERRLLAIQVVSLPPPLPSSPRK
jgi:hypothetical protein